jgi:ESS family glutamate:Na+ symporter
MDFSSSNSQLWLIIVQGGALSLLLLFANLLRRKIPLLQRSLLPTAVIAGFTGLILRQIGIIDLNTFFLEGVTYHMIAIGFIAIGLRVPKLTAAERASGSTMRDGTNTGLLIVSNYLLQGVVGLTIMLILSVTVMPDIFTAAGLLLPLSFGQGPGQANNIGTSYEIGYGFSGGASFGLALATMGFLWASIGGIIYINYMKRKGVFNHQDGNYTSRQTSPQVEEPDEIPLSEAADRFTIQFALIMSVYFITWILSHGFVKILGSMPQLEGIKNTLSPLIWGFNFLIGSSLALLLRGSFSFLRKTGIMTHQYPNNYLLNRIAGLAFDLMIVAAICAIEIGDLTGLWIPFILLSLIGGAWTLFYNIKMSRMIYPDYPIEGLLSIYGMMTGTVSTGILLLREADPHFKTPASMNLVTGSSVAIIVGLPLLIMVGLAPQSVLFLWLTLAACTIYALVLNIVLFKRSRQK